MVRVKRGGSWVTVPEGSKLNLTTTPKRTTSKITRSVKSGEGVYYDIDDPSQALVKDGESYAKVTDPIQVVRRGGGGGSSQQLGQVITPGQATSPPITFDEGRKTSQEFGVLTLSDREAPKTYGSSAVGWYVDTRVTSPSEAIGQGEFVSQIPQVSRPIKTRGMYEYNIQNIIAGKKVYDIYSKTEKEFKADPESFTGQKGVTTTETGTGITYSLTPEFFDSKINASEIYGESLKEAKQEFSRLPKSERTKLNIGGFWAGGSGAVIGAVEFAGTVGLNLGQQTATKEEGFKDRKFRFSQSTTFGDIKTYPTTQTTVKFFDSPKQYTKEKLGSPEFLGSASVIVPAIAYGGYSAVSNIKQYGFKAGALETASGLSPLKIRSGIYTEPVTSNTKFKVTSYKYTSDKGVTTRLFSGKGGTNIKISGFETSRLVNGKSVGAGITTTRIPYFEVRGGGAILTKGTSYTASPYSFGGVGSGSATAFSSKMITPILDKGGVSDVILSRGATSYKGVYGEKLVFNDPTKALKFTTGTATRGYKPGVKTFGSGRATPVYTTTKTGDLFVYQPSGKYRFTPQVTGTEFNINKLVKGGTSGFSSSTFGGTGGTKQLYKFSQSGLKAVIPTAPSTILPPSKGVIGIQLPKTTPATPGFSSRSSFQVPTTTQVPETKTTQDIINIQVPKVGSVSRGRSKTAPILTTIPEVTQLPGKKTTTKVITIPKITTKQRVGSKSPVGASFAYGAGAGGFGGFGGGVGLPVPFIPGFGGIRGMGVGRVKAVKAETRYTPSFSAFVFGIKGTQKTASKTGIDFRPITPGFKLQKKRKLVKKVRRVKKKK